MRALLPVLLIVSATAVAAPVSVTHGGYLLGATDAPVTQDDVPATFALFDAVTGGAAVWQSAGCQVDVRAGYYAVTLGGDCNGSPALDGAHLPAGADRWLELTLNGATLTPRIRLGAAPSAVNAQNALSLGGVAASSYARLDQAAVHTADVSVAGAAQFSGKGTGLTDLAASAITVGTIADAQLASGSNLAKLSGAQTFTGAKAFSAQASFTAGLTSAADVAATGGAKFVGDGSGLTNLPGAANGARTDAANNFTLLNTFSAGLRLGNVASCSDANAGTLRWTGALLQACIGTAGQWVTLASSLGQSQTTPATSCNALLASGQTQSNLYWIDPNGGPTTDAFYTYCDMTTDQGGWTLLWSQSFVGNQGGPTNAQMTSTYGTPGLANDFSLNPVGQYTLLGATRFLVKEDSNWIRFNSISQTTFAAIWNMSPDGTYSVTSMNGTTYNVGNGYHGHGSGVNQFGQTSSATANSSVIFEYNALTGTRDVNHYWHVWPAANGTYAQVEGVGGTRRGSVWVK